MVGHGNLISHLVSSWKIRGGDPLGGLHGNVHAMCIPTGTAMPYAQWDSTNDVCHRSGFILNIDRRMDSE